jgi:hypothetical protein
MKEKIRTSRLLLTAGVILPLILQGCASARMSDRESDNLFREGKYVEAAESLKKGFAKQGEGSRDELLYLLDIGLALHTAGLYDESNKYLLKADKVAEIKDYTSLSSEAATLVTSDNIKGYKGEDFENTLISMYLALNYAMKGDYENSLVEARRVNRKLQLMITQGERKYKQNAFARYLSAIVYEAEGNWNDAYIDYKETYKIEPTFPGLGRDLWRMASFLHMTDKMEDWDKEFDLSKEDHEKAKLLSPKKGRGELIVIYENGISPIKRPNPDFYSVPKFFPRPNPVLYADVEVDGQVAGPTIRLHDIEATAIENLNEKYAGIIAKKLAGVVVKEVAGNAVAKATGSQLLGQLSKLAMYASDQADVRSWNLLPRDLQVARIPVDPGKHKVKLNLAGGGSLPEREVTVKAGKKVFLNWRYMP